MKDRKIKNADMAQQAEHVLGKDEVTGSNPVISSSGQSPQMNTHSRFVGAFCFIPALLHKNGSLCILDNILHSMLYCDSKANVNGRRLERPSRGGVAMDEVSVLYLIVILYLIKEIIRISNKKR